MKRNITLTKESALGLSNVYHRIAGVYAVGKTSVHAGVMRAKLVAKTKALIYSDLAADM